MLALLGEKQRHHAVGVVAVARRAEQNVHRRAPAHLDHAGRGVVAGLPAVEPVALVDEHGCKRLGRIADGGKHLHKRGDLLLPPAEVIRPADPGVRAAVAHGDEHVVFLQGKLGTENFFAADVQLLRRIAVRLVVADQNDTRVVILDQLGRAVIFQVDDREGRIGHAALGADRQGRGDRLDAFVQRHILGHHGRDDFRGQRGENAGLHAASQAVREHQHRRILALLDQIHMVAAELLAGVVDALPADLFAEIIHP